VRLEAWLQRVWYSKARPPAWLKALAALYGAIMRLRAALYARGWLRSVRVGVPVIVVGNVTVGGTGKTPLVIWLAQALRGLGYRVAVVSRGYGRRAAWGTLRVKPSSSAEEVGDEPLLIHRRTGCPVFVDGDRVRAARAAIAAGAQLVIADDGLQHLRLARDAEIIAIDAQRGLGNGSLLPAGPLREPASRLGRATAVVLTGAAAADERFPGALPMWLAGEQLLRVNAIGSWRALEEFAGQRVHALAAIGNPGRFFAALRAAGIDPIEHPRPDHDPFQLAELRFGDGLPVIMTEKDAVKCQAYAPEECWYLPVSAQFDAADSATLLKGISMDARLLEILACPVCKGPLRQAGDAGGKLLVCRADRLAFPLRNDIPAMLPEEARVLEATDPLLER